MDIRVLELESAVVKRARIVGQGCSGLALLHDAHVTLVFERQASETVAGHAVLCPHVSRQMSESRQYGPATIRAAKRCSREIAPIRNSFLRLNGASNLHNEDPTEIVDSGVRHLLSLCAQILPR